MSRSNPQLTNPATRFFEWKGGSGTLGFYDKEKKEIINVPLPFSFLPLDELSTITGFDKAETSGFWSNEVRNITKDELIVRSKSGIRAQGLYKNNQGVVQMPRGAVYAKSVYMAYKTRDGWQIGNFKASGSALSAWIEFSKSCIPENGKVTISQGEQQDSQVGAFYPPIFDYSSSDNDEDTIAFNLDKQLQTYLEQYLKQPPITDIEDEIANGVTTDDLPQENPSRSSGAEAVSDEPPTDSSASLQPNDEKKPSHAASIMAEARDRKLSEKQEDEAIKDLLENQHNEILSDQAEFDPNDIPF